MGPGRALAIAVAIFVMFLTDSAWSCSCNRRGTADSYVQNADAVFIGFAINISKLKDGNARSAFKVVEAFKGTQNSAILKIEHRTFGPACGFGFSRSRL